MNGTTFEQPEPEDRGDGAKELYDHALRWVNAFRTEYRMQPLPKLLKGEQAHAYECPIARSLPGNTVTMCGEFKIDDGLWRPLPHVVRTFQQEFDRGNFPWLIDGMETA